MKKMLTCLQSYRKLILTFDYFSAPVPEKQVLSVDESKFYSPPNKLHLPETPVHTSDSANSLPESDVSSSESSRSNSPRFEQDIPEQSSTKSTPSKVDRVSLNI